MAPQPLNTYSKIGSVSFGGMCVAQRPEQAVLMAQVIARWADIEVSLGGLAGSLGGISAVFTTEMYSSLSSFQAQSAMLEAAARSVIEQPYLDIFLASLIAVRRPARQRHRFAHWQWGMADWIPDAPLLQDPKDHWRESAASKEWIHKQQRRLNTKPYPMRVGTSHFKDILVYKSEDFRGIISDMDRATSLTYKISGLIPRISPARDQLYSQLSSEPEIQAILRKMRSLLGSARPTQP